MADFIHCKHVVLGNSERFIAAANRQAPYMIFDVRAGDNRDDTFVPPRLIGLDVLDSRVRVGTSQNRDVERIRKIDIVNVLGLTSNQPGIFAPFDIRANQLAYWHLLARFPIFDFGFSTAAKIIAFFWGYCSL
jgi:hypothetical protein